MFILVLNFNIFAYQFLKLKNYNSAGIGFKIMNIISLIALFSVLILETKYRFYIFKTFYIFMIIHFVYILFTIGYLFIKKSSNVLIFSLAFLPIILSLSITIFISFKILPAMYLSYDLPMLATLIEFIVFIIALLFEVKKHNDERNTLIIEQSNQQKKILEAYTTGQEDTNIFVSQELHDNVGSKLALLKHKIGNSINKSIISDINSIEGDIVNITKAIDSKSLELIGLKNTIENYVLNFNKNSDIKIELSFNNFSSFKGPKTIEIHRVIQEATTNALKYSKANIITLNIYQKNNLTTITINDNGIGFNIAERKKDSTGIQNMKNRIQQINGEFTITSEQGVGTEIKIIIKK